MIAPQVVLELDTKINKETQRLINLGYSSREAYQKAYKSITGKELV